MNDIVKCLRRPVTYPDSASARIDRRAADYIETLQRELDKACGCTIDEGGDVTDKCDWHFEAAKLDRAEIDRLQRERDELKADQEKGIADYLALQDRCDAKHNALCKAERERDEARDERDIFKRTLDKRDEELEWYRNHAISLGNVIQQALAVRPYESNYGTAYRSMMFILGDALKGEGE